MSPTFDASTEELVVPAAHGRSVSLRLGGNDDAIEVHAPDGRSELTITFGPDGPRVHLTTADVAIDTLGDVKIECDRFDVNAKHELNLRTVDDVRVDGREIRVQMTRDVDLRGRIIRLNSPEGAPMHPALKALKNQQKALGDGHSCGCHPTADGKES